MAQTTLRLAFVDVDERPHMLPPESEFSEHEALLLGMPARNHSCAGNSSA
jgi:hypothetical protein